MLDAYLGIIVVSVLAFSLFVVWLKYLRSQSSLNLCICLLVAGIIAAPAPASALEIRHDDDVVVIPASETIDDTLLVAAESIMVEGNVTGSIIAVGHSKNPPDTSRGASTSLIALPLFCCPEARWAIALFRREGAILGTIVSHLKPV